MSQLRKDLVSGEWVIVAPERMKRPHHPPKRKAFITPRARCPFEDLKKSGNWPPILLSPNDNNWKIAVISNKYPAVRNVHGKPRHPERSLYPLREGIGEHELVITRDHVRRLVDAPPEEAALVFQTFKQRQEALSRMSVVRYVSMFLNQGPATGGSISHPHYQIVGLPIVPPDVLRSLAHSRAYYKQHARCIHCVMMRYEIKKKTRVVAENVHAVALAPFASRTPYEVRIYPKRHIPVFSGTDGAALRDAAILLREILHRMKRTLRDPDLNFFIHGVPLKDTSHYRSYHWHIEIAPKIAIAGGFELSTGMGVNVVDPYYAARVLRDGKIPCV